MTPRVVLVGPMGAGKSAVGALLAADLGLVLRDSDADVEAAAGAAVADVFAREGEAGFRARERAAVAAALADHDGVLALGGGAVTDPGTRALLRGSGVPVVLLSASWEHVRARVRDGAGRPLLRPGAGAAGAGATGVPSTSGAARTAAPEERWRALAAGRQALYDEVATAVVSTDGLTAQQVAECVLQVLLDAGTAPPPAGSGGAVPAAARVGRPVPAAAQNVGGPSGHATPGGAGAAGGGPPSRP